MNTTRLIAFALAGLVLAAAGLAFAAFGGSDDGHTTEHLVATPPDGAGLAAADLNRDGIVYQDGMHPHVVRDAPGKCPICGMDLMPVRVDGAEVGTVRIDPVTMQNIGVRTAPVEVVALQRSVRTTGRFEASERGLSAVSPKIGGWVERLYVAYEGARVSQGQPLLTIYSPELVSTQEEYLLALRHADRMGGTADSKRLVDAARRRLANWDVSEAQIESLKTSGTPQKTITLYAPASGTVVRKDVVEGQQIVPGTTLLELSDLSRLWLMVDVYEQDLAWVKVGTVAEIALPYDPGRKLMGRIDYLYDTLDPATRTLKARVTVPNPGLQLKPGMYATVTLRGEPGEPLPVVPQEALIPTADGGIVIVALSERRFRPVEVLPGASGDGRVQILRGLNGTEQVVTSAQFLIDSEARLKSAIGAMASGHRHGDAVTVTPPGRTAPEAARATEADTLHVHF